MPANNSEWSVPFSPLEPANIDAEFAIIGGIILDPGAMARIAHTLPVEAFYVVAHRTIYQVALQLHHRGKPVDLMTLTTVLADTGQLERVGGKAALVQFLDAVVSAANIDHYAELVLEKHQRRCMVALGAAIQELGQNVAKPIPACLREAEAGYRQLLELTTSSQQAVHISEVVTANLEAAKQGKPLGVPTGFYDVDALINGVQRGKLTILAGRPAMGKTAALANIARNIAAAGHGVLLISLEMDRDELGYRLLSAESRLGSNEVRSGQLNSAQWHRLEGSVSQLAGLPLWLDDAPAQSVDALTATIQRLQAEIGNEKLLLVMVDYLQLMEVADTNNRVVELGRISRGLKRLARELNISVWALSQLSRGVEARTNKRPMMSDLRESGNLEQDADKIIMLYRDEYYDPDCDDVGVAEWIVVKHRGGATGTARLLFDPGYTQFRNMRD
ncbi:replicative DNA helicase [Leptolyngbya sp. PCC 7375]|nr:replicative DNA helicase [Leptolyngbya sp. PCC 7375]